MISEPERSLQETEKAPVELDLLTKKIEEKPESLAYADKEIREAALVAAKYIFDLALRSEASARPHLTALLESIQRSQAPQTRAQARAALQAKQEQTSKVSTAIVTSTPLDTLVIDGMDDEQIWAELELKTKNVCETLETVFDANESVDARGTRMSDESDEDNESEEDSLDFDDLEEAERKYMEGLDDSEDSLEDDSVEEDETESDGNDDIFLEGQETVAPLRDSSDDDSEDEQTILSQRRARAKSQAKARSRNSSELDDGFFDLTEFNAEIEEAEAKKVSRGTLGEDSEDSDDDMLDLYTSIDGADESGEGARYEDFYEAPKKQAKSPKPKSQDAKGVRNSRVKFNDEVKVKTIKQKGKGRPLSSIDLYTGDQLEDDEDSEEEYDDVLDEENSDGDDDFDDEVNDGDSFESSEQDDTNGEGRAAVERVKDDLFADEEETMASDLTAHEARMAAIRDQIAQLEAENIAEKEWMLKGEVSSRKRPLNALLEEDLDFETVQKAVPVVTDEVVKDLEDRIKSRIIENRFDDVVRKRSIDDKPFLPSRIFELQDTKSKESLAQIYENEYMATQSEGNMDDRDGKLQKEYEEIEKQWESICYKLDALSNAHFTPKQPKVTISTVSNTSAITMESALPTAKATSTILAPEEVFAPDASELRAKSEMTPAEKKAAHLKERKKKKKQRDLLDKSVDKFARSKGVKKQKEEALKSIVKTGKGVTVVGKKSPELKKNKRKA